MLTFPRIERTDTMELPLVAFISGLAAGFITPFWPWMGFVVGIPLGLVVTYWLVTGVRNCCARLLWAYSFPKRISARKLQTLLAHDTHRYVLHIQYNSGGFDCTQEKPAAVLEDKVASTLIAIHPASWKVTEVCEKAGVSITKHCLETGQISEIGVEKKRLTRQGSRGLVNPLLDVLVVVAIIGILAAIAIPNLIRPHWPPAKFRRAAGDTKSAVTQSIVYVNDKGVYPTSLKVMREAGYAIVPDKDPWGNEYVLSPVLTRGGTPREEFGNVYVFSRGRKGTGEYPQPFTHDTGKDGAIGYSSVDGCFGPEHFDLC